MIKRLLFIPIFLFLVSSAFAQWNGGGSPITGNATDGYSLPGSLSMGTPTSQITADTVLTEAQCMNHVYEINAATALKVQLPAPTSNKGSVVFMGASTFEAGLTPWCNTAIRWGTGPSATSGTSPFLSVTSGITGYVLAFKAVQLPAGTYAWKLLDQSAAISQ